jgi:hypothetical protein
MAQDPKKTAASAPADDAEIQVRVVGQFIKDLSFENPNVGKMLEGPGDNPNLKIEVNVNANQMGPDLYGSDIEFSAVASSKAGKIYELELVYGLVQDRIDATPGTRAVPADQLPSADFPVRAPPDRRHYPRRWLPAVAAGSD